MKKFLFIFLMIFSFFIINSDVYAASELYDYMFTTAEVKAGDNSYFTGSRNPGITTGVTSNYSYFSFGYYNLSNTFHPGQKYRITADYCTNNNNYVRYDVVGKSGVSSFDLSYKKGSTCAYTTSDGTVFVGNLISFTFDFVIDSTDYTTGFVKFNFFFDSTNWHWLGFKDYRIFSSSEITSSDNTQNIINNQNNNTQDIIDNQNQNQQQTNDRLDSINGSLTDDSIPDNNSNQANEWANSNASDSVVSDMVLMPITLLNAFYSGFNGTCQSYNLGSFYGTNLTLPCINVSNYLGSTLWGIIDVLMSGLLIYGIGKKFVKVFNDFTNLKDSQVDELYGGGSDD